ncbi:hypothetical protein ACERII_05585 [Evansella sp. AB-rgal1]|uniref:hypothetical protein n=1 Tax=Evansella sp. AB-rgal1 TaxID=3242696 RepID=UPI00359E8939
MSDEQMNRFEGMLTQLISMVGHIQKSVDTLKEDMIEIKADMAAIKADRTMKKTEMSLIKTEMPYIKETKEKQQHAEVMGKLELLRMDQEITWAKTVENERNIERLTRQLSNN